MSSVIETVQQAPGKATIFTIRDNCHFPRLPVCAPGGLKGLFDGFPDGYATYDKVRAHGCLDSDSTPDGTSCEGVIDYHADMGGHEALWNIPTSGELNMIACAVAGRTTCYSPWVTSRYVVLLNDLKDAVITFFESAADSLTFRIDWPGSTVALIVMRPDGTTALASDAGVSHSIGSTFEEYTIDDPATGDWTVRMIGLDVEPGGEPVDLTVATVLAPEPDEDADNVADADDNCVSDANWDQTDTDADTIGNACDPNDDGDAHDDPDDNCALVANDNQADADSDSLGDACDGDNDNDGMEDAAEAAHPCLSTAVDDSAGDPDSDTLVNLLETLIASDPCAPDTDADALSDPLELYCGANSSDAASKPERLDGAYAGVDDNGDGLTDEALPDAASGYDCDGDGLTGDQEVVALTAPQIADTDADSALDGADNCPNWTNPTQALPAWTVPANDSDCDGWNVTRETRTGTDRTDHCNADTVRNNEGLDAWPPDFDDNQIVNLSDVLAFNAVFGAKPTDGNWNVRFDVFQTATVIINLSDVLAVNPYFGLRCAPLP